MKKRSIALCWIFGILIIAITALPFYVIFNLSIRTINDLGSKLRLPSNFNWSNYSAAFSDISLWRGFANSLAVTIMAVVLIILYSFHRRSHQPYAYADGQPQADVIEDDAKCHAECDANG